MKLKKSLENVDYRRRYMFYKIEPYLVVLRSIINNRTLDSEFRVFSRFEIFRLTSNHRFPNNFRNRCLVTGRSRSVVRYFKVSRIEFRRMAKLGKFIGVTKSSWLSMWII